MSEPTDGPRVNPPAPARLASVALVAALWLPSPARAQGFPAWLGLYEPVQLGWLENENRLRELCADPSLLAECHAESLGPSVRVYSLHTRADAASSRVGELIVVAVPGRGLSAHFRPAASQEAVRFTPDLFLQDWGYGPWFHMTLADRRGEWFQLPAGPWDRPVWIRRTGEGGEPPVLAVRPGDILEMDGSGWYVLGAEPDALLLRPEQPADQWCREGNPPRLTPTEPTRVTRAELLDDRGHLTIGVRYPKGC